MKKRAKIAYFLGISILVFLSVFSSIGIYKKNEEKKHLEEKLKNFQLLNTEVKQVDRNTKYLLLRQKYDNPEIKGTLSIEGIGLETLLLQTTNNSYYMSHLPDKEVSTLGSTFIDYRSNLTDGFQVNIYGHNSTRIDTDFHKLEKFLDKDSFDKYQELIIETEEGINHYQIFFVKVITEETDDVHTKIMNKNENFTNHINDITRNSRYIREYNLESKQVVILQTCLLKDSHEKYLLVGAYKL